MAYTVAASLVAMDEPRTDTQQTITYKTLPFHPKIRQPDGTVWEFFADSKKAFFTQIIPAKENRCSTSEKFEGLNFPGFVTARDLKEIHFCGLVEPAAYTLMAVLFATVKRKDDACIFVRFSHTPVLHLPGIIRLEKRFYTDLSYVEYENFADQAYPRRSAGSYWPYTLHTR